MLSGGLIRRLESGSLKKIFEEISGILVAAQCPVWVDCGLLLKNSRGDSIFPSSDLDFGIFSHNKQQIFDSLERFRKHGFWVGAIGDMSRAFEGIKLVKRDADGTPVTCDIYFYYAVGDCYIRPNIHKPYQSSIASRFAFLLFLKAQREIFGKRFSLIPRRLLTWVEVFIVFIYFSFFKCNRFVFPKWLLSAFEDDTFEGGIKLKVPKEKYRLLVWRYGYDWQTPRKDYRFSDGFMVDIGSSWALMKDFFRSPIVNNEKEFEKLDSSSQSKKISPFKFSKSELRKIKVRMLKREIYSTRLRSYEP